MPVTDTSETEQAEPLFGSLPLEILEAEDFLLALINNNGSEEIDDEGRPMYPTLSQETEFELLRAVAGLQIGRKYLVRIGEYLDDEITEEQFHAAIRQDFDAKEDEE